MSTRILDFGDPHVSDQPPIGRIPGYREQILAKLEEIGRICREKPEGIDTVIAICKGDLFHQKRPSFVSHYLVGQLQQIFWQLGVDVYLLPGNHDMGPGGLEGLRRQPLSVLDGGPVHVVAPGVTDSSQVLPLDDLVIFWRPYSIERDADPTYYQLDEAELLIAQNAPHTMLVAHGSIILPGDEKPYPTVKLDEIDLTGIEVLTTGHLHEDVGVTLLNDTWFINTGCVGRTQRTQANMDRESIDIISMVFTPGIPPSIERIPLVSALPPEEVFIDKIIEGEDVVSDAIVEFAEDLAQSAAEDGEIPLEQILSDLDAPEPVKTRIRTYLERSGF